MEQAAHYLEQIAYGIDFIGIVILLYGSTLAIIHFTWCEIQNQFFDGTNHRDAVRIQLGRRTLFALELMIASDLIHTVLGRTMDDLVFLGALVVIRTTISFFLGRELKELEEHAHAQAK